VIIKPHGCPRPLGLSSSCEGVSFGQEGLQFVNQRAGSIELAFPDDKHRPTHSTQSGAGGTIAFLVSEQLRFPILKARTRQSTSAAAQMHVPETSVNEDDLRLFGKHNIRASRQISSMEPVAEPATMKKTSNLALRLCIPALDAPHVLASALWRYIIHFRLSRPRNNRTITRLKVSGVPA
jgi:hypothetical protein